MFDSIASRKRTVIPFLLCLFLLGTSSSHSFALATENTAIYTIDPQLFAGDDNPTEPILDDADVKSRLREMFCSITPQYTDIVKSYIRGYVGRNKEKTQNILGRSILYFPILEKQLREAGLPDDMKYVAVLESALSPTATSPAGARGIWQMMPATGAAFGLRIDSYVDERADIEKSSIAAAKYLIHLYEKYNDWALALAAYNAGPARINEAIKRAHSTNFWVIQKHLSKQTQQYVPAFIAAAYVMQYYMAHEVLPSYPELDLQLTKTVKTDVPVSFYQLAQITQLPLNTIQRLNPCYSQEFIPAAKGSTYPVILPARSVKLFNAFLDNPEGWIFSDAVPVMAFTTENNDRYYYKTAYTVQDGDYIEAIAKQFGCTAYSIRAWNNLTSGYIHKGQELTMFLVEPPKVAEPVVELPKRKKISTPKRLKKLPLARAVHPSHTQGTRLQPAAIKRTPPTPTKRNSFGNVSHKGATLYHQVENAETLADVIAQYPGVTMEEVLSLNQQLQSHTPPQVGMKIILKKF